MMTKWSIHGPARQLEVRHFLQLIEQLVSSSLVPSLPQLTGDTSCRTLPQLRDRDTRHPCQHGGHHSLLPARHWQRRFLHSLPSQIKNCEY